MEIKIGDLYKHKYENVLCIVIAVPDIRFQVILGKPRQRYDYLYIGAILYPWAVDNDVNNGFINWEKYET